MPHSERLHQLLPDLYGLTPQTITPLKQQQTLRRGIYRVEDAQGRAVVVRLMQQQAPHFARAAALLSYLDACGYPAPRVIPTRTGSAVGETSEWCMLLTTYLAGSEIDVTPAQLEAVGARLTELHTLPPAPTGLRLPDSWWPPTTIAAEVHQQLIATSERWPDSFQPLVRQLIESASQLEAGPGLPTTLVHGDCWHYNAIEAPDGRIALIDWDAAGYGPALLDLATLLVASHFDLRQPLVYRPDRELLHAMLRGYTAVRPLSADEWAQLPATLYFFFADSARKYAGAMPEIDAEELYPRKLKLRVAALGDMAAYVEQYREDVL